MWLAAGCLLAGPALAEKPAPAKSTPFQGQPRVIPGLIEAEDFDEGGEGVAYHDEEPENQETKRPLYRESGVDLEWREAASNKFNLGWTRPGEWLLYTAEVREAGTYRIDMQVACAGKGGTFRILADGKDVTGAIQLPDTGGWAFLKPLAHEGMKLGAGKQVLKLVLESAGVSGSIGDIDYFKFTRTGP